MRNQICAFLTLSCLLIAGNKLYATNYFGSPGDYLDFVSLLEGGDTLFLAPGTYIGRLRLIDVVGQSDNHIVISGPAQGDPAIFVGNAAAIL